MTIFQFVGVVLAFFMSARVALADLHVQITPELAAESATDEARTPDELLEQVRAFPARKLAIHDAMRLLKASKIRNDKGELGTSVYLHLERGLYRLSKPIRIDTSSGGSSTHSINVLGPEGGGAVLLGSQPIRNFVSVTNSAVLGRLSAGARESVLQADLSSQGITDYGIHRQYGFGHPRTPAAMELFFRGEPLTIARWPNKAYAKIHVSPELSSARQFRIVDKNLSQWAGESSVSVFGYWRYYWADETLNVQSIDEASGVVSLFSPGPKYGLKDGQPVFFQNIFSELDERGEWYLDAKAGVVYLWPSAPPGADDVEASVLDSLVVVEGARNVNISGLTFLNVRGSAIVINQGRAVTVSDSIISNTGSSGVVIRGYDSGVDRVRINNTGGAGVVLAGGDRQTLTPGNLYVKNSTIQRFGRLARSYQPAVDVSGVGNSAVGNVMSDAPHSAIVFHGNNHLISGNIISRVCLEAGDAGVIYTGRDWTARGTVISGNIIKDIPLNKDRGGVFAIYLDDQASGITVRANKIYKAYVGVFIGGGRDNVIESNEIHDSYAAPIHLDARGVGWQAAMTNDPKGALRAKLQEVPYANSPYKDQYPNLANLLNDQPGRPKYNVLKKNIITGSSSVRILDEAKGGVSILDMGN